MMLETFLIFNFYCREESFPMKTSLDMNNNFVYNVKSPVNIDQAVNKKYVDDELKNKADLTSDNKQTFIGQIEFSNVFLLKKLLIIIIQSVDYI